jgi:fatty acid desaturase
MQIDDDTDIRRNFDSLKPDDALAFRLLGLHVLAILVLLAIILMSPNRLTFWSVTSAVMLGYTFARCLELGHALMHGRFFSFGLCSLNRGVGCAVTMPFLLPWTQWRWTHFHHHKDPRIEGFDYPDVRSIRDIPSLVAHYLMLSHWTAVLRRTVFAFIMPERVREEINHILLNTVPLPDRVHRKIIFEYRINFFIWGGFLLGFYLFAPAAVSIMFIIWLSATVSHVMIEFPEHVLADLDAPDPEQNSFEITSSPLADFLTMNNTRHATHHRFPEVPIYHLPTVSEQLDHEHASKDYASFWRRFTKENFTLLASRNE